MRSASRPRQLKLGNPGPWAKPASIGKCNLGVKPERERSGAIARSMVCTSNACVMLDMRVCVSSSSRCLNHSFFFQAEDGIRSLTVTGVQTCALPVFEIVTNVPDVSGALSQAVEVLRKRVD